jgi:transposase
MDALESVQSRFRAQMAHWIKPLLDRELSVVFYDLTTIRVQGEARLEDDIRAFGLNKDTGGIARQVLLGVVQSAEGIPLDFEVFAGNTAEVTTLLPMIQRVRSRYPIQRIVLVADRGLLSLDNIAEIEALATPRHAAPDFILAVPAARYGDLHETLATLTFADHEPSIREAQWAGRRLVVAHDPELAARSRERREATLAELTTLGDRLADKLNAQDAGVTERGRRASDRGAYKRFHQAVSQAHFSRFIEADLSTECFSYAVKEDALEKARRLDGTLILITSCRDFAAADVVSRYKALADIERGFRTLKSDIEIAPMYHRLPRRIWAHSALCFMALFLHRVMRMKIHSRQAPFSVTRAMEQLHAVQLHKVRFSQQTLTGISTLTPTQKSIFDVLDVAEPRMTAL